MPVSISGAGSISGLDQGFNVTSGNLGIGTDNPSHELDIESVSPTIELKDSDNDYKFQLTQSGSATYIDFDTDDGGSSSLRIRNAYDEKIRIQSDGKVGIGTNNPVSKLELWNNSNIEVLRLRDTHFNKYLTIRGGGSPNRMVIDSYEGSGGGADIDLASNGSTKLRITSGGQVNIGGDLTQTGFTASITRNSSETDILRIKGNGGNAFVRFEDNDASSSFTLGADDAVGSGGFALYDRSDSAYRVVVDTAGRVSINATSPVPLDGQTPYLYVASGYTNLDGLRIRGLDTGNTLWKTGGDMSLSIASNDAINLKTNGITRFVLNANSNNSTTLSIGNGNNLTNNTSPDRTSVKVGGTLHLEASNAGSNHKTGMYYNCHASGQSNFYQGTFGASSFDYRAAAATMNHGTFKVYTDPSTSTNYAAGAQITTMKETLTCANGFVTMPNQPCFFATSNTGGSHTSNGYTGIISNQLEAAYVNVGNHYNTSTGIFTCPVAGTYEFHGQGLIRWQTGAGRAELSFYKNGSNTISRSYGYTYVTGSPDHDNLHVMGYITCAVNDQIDLRVYGMDAGVDCYWGQGLGYFAGRLVQ